MKNAVALLIWLALYGAAEAETMRFKCKYTLAFTLGQSAPEIPKDFSLEFAVDTVSGKSVMMGNAGVEDVPFHVGSAGITFLESLPTGAVQSTTITIPGGASVHSRHTMMAGDLVPSQYYGKCN